LSTSAPHFRRIEPQERGIKTGAANMSLLAHLFADVSAFDVAMALIAVGVFERVLYLLPEHMVGDGGWLLDLGPAPQE
jgi:hypothetical protein